MKKSIRCILAAVIIFTFALLAVGSGSSDSKETTSYAWSAQSDESVAEQTATETTTVEETTARRNYKLGETFTMADFEVTLGSSYSIVKINNQFSDKNGKDVVKVPITIKNVGSETTDFPLYINYYGSKGTEVDDPTYFFDDSLSTSSKLRPGASQSGYLYFMYDGNGIYGLDFEELFSWSDDTISVEFEVTK